MGCAMWDMRSVIPQRILHTHHRSQIAHRECKKVPGVRITTNGTNKTNRTNGTHIADHISHIACLKRFLDKINKTYKMHFPHWSFK